MTYSGHDWTVLWKLYHFQFFWIYLLTGIPLKVIVARLSKASPLITSLSAVVSSFVSSVLSTWLPIVAIACGAALVLAAGKIADSTFIVAPLVAAAMAIETAFVDVLVFRVLLRRYAKTRFAPLFIANVLNSSTALAIILIWASLYPVEMIAHANSTVP